MRLSEWKIVSSNVVLMLNFVPSVILFPSLKVEEKFSDLVKLGPAGVKEKL